MSRPSPSDEMDTIAYAVSFLQAAKIIGMSRPYWDDNADLIIPFYALIGAAIENGLKAALEYRGVEPRKAWFHSHDLLDLLRRAGEFGDLVTSDEERAFIRELSAPHKEFQFRYPQKAHVLTLLKPPVAIVLTESMLGAVFVLIGGPHRLD